ncbi:hypothetical protein [Streptomyces marincola]|uniref:hypothetical protein n=1 Tax=Streptomyces marincola TaxID=2878388 RepID=UPI001CF39685|nr:hypothetical protein [Streptomyces marincola]UCM90441.1 hypothetical protein LC193_22290 [Streptomyces marincola]
MPWETGERGDGMGELPPDESLVRGAMERAVDGLLPPPGLVHGAIALAERRRARARALGLGAGVCLAAAAVTAALALSARPGGAAEPAPPLPAAPPAQSAFPEATSTPDLAADAAARAEDDHRRQVAAALRDLLTPAVTEVTPVAGDIDRYQGRGPNGASFTLTLQVRPPGDGPLAGPCASTDTRPGACAAHTLADGTPVAVHTGVEAGLPSIAARARFGTEDLFVEITPDTDSRVGALVATERLLAFLANPQVRSLAMPPNAP